MAKPPDIEAIARDTIPQAPGWLEKLLRPLNSHLGATTRALAHGLTFADNFAAVEKSFTVTMPDDWVPVTLLNGWFRHPDLGFLLPAQRKDSQGEVTTRGLIQRTGIPAIGSPLFTTPFPNQSRGRLFNLSGGATSEVDFPSPATPTTFQTSSADILFLDRITYTAADRRPAQPGAPFPLRLACVSDAGVRLPGRPAHLWVTACMDLDTSLGVPLPAPQWEPATFDGATGVLLRNLVGLTPLRRYRVTVVIAAA